MSRRALGAVFRRVLLAVPLAACGTAYDDPFPRLDGSFGQEEDAADPMFREADAADSAPIPPPPRVDAGPCARFEPVPTDAGGMCGEAVPVVGPGCGVGDCLWLCAKATNCMWLDGGTHARCGCEVPGRWTAGIERRGLDGAGPAAFFAWMAWGEGTAVFAFERLARELGELGAPEALVRRARRAGADERRHAALARTLAQRFGAAAPLPTEAMDETPRSLEDVALENAVEGCVGETWSALLAEVQARRATDPVVARALRAIARDELRHATLAWDVAAWIEGIAPPALSERVREARRARGAELASSEAWPAADATLGLPTPQGARALAAGLREALWS